MWAALYSMAFVSDDMEYVVEEALNTIPEQSDFYACIKGCDWLGIGNIQMTGNRLGLNARRSGLRKWGVPMAFLFRLILMPR